MNNWNNITKRLKQEIISPNRNFSKKLLFITITVNIVSIKTGKRKFHV